MSAEEEGGLNLYEFVGNDRINWLDPWGQWKGDRGTKKYPKVFRNWLHKRKQDEKRTIDYTPKEIKELYQEWLDLGKPDPRAKYGAIAWTTVDAHCMDDPADCLELMKALGIYKGKQCED